MAGCIHTRAQLRVAGGLETLIGFGVSIMSAAVFGSAVGGEFTFRASVNGYSG